MLITEHAKKQLEIRFGIKANDEDINYRVAHGKLMTPDQVNRCGSKYKIGFNYIRYRDMILVCSKDYLVNVFLFYNPYRTIKREAQDNHQRSSV